MHKHIIRFVVVYSVYASLHIFVASTHLALELQRHKPAEHPMHIVLLIFLFFVLSSTSFFFRSVSFESSYSYILVCISLLFFVLAHFSSTFISNKPIHFMFHFLFLFIVQQKYLYHKIYVILFVEIDAVSVYGINYAPKIELRNRKQNTH